ncbi:MAG: Smr/MutS family protein, partial [Bacteroidia bacterium]|nr:Smr/MutS family protein [Bacteroidia bacterium]
YLLDGWQQMRSDSKPPKLVVQTKKRGRPLPVSGHHIITAGSFDIEIDLHIDKLTAHHHNLDKLQKLTIQLESMKRYIDTAKRLRIDHVFLIHGVGKGKLRDEIAKILRKDEDILYFKNEYHPKYGYGATEVVFR